MPPTTSSIPIIIAAAVAQATPLYLNRRDAAAYITKRVGFLLTETVLANLACRGVGPRYRIWRGQGSSHGGRGRFAAYKPTDLDSWIESQLHEPSVGALNNGSS